MWKAGTNNNTLLPMKRQQKKIYPERYKSTTEKRFEFETIMKFLKKIEIFRKNIYLMDS